MMPQQPPNNGASGSGAAGNPWLNYYQQWSERTPLVARTTTVAICVAYLLSFFIPLEAYLGNTPFFSVQHFEIYRFLLSPLVGNSILSLVVILLSYPTTAQRMENSSGSGAFLSLLLIITLITNGIFTIFCYTLYIFGIYTEAIFLRSAGFFPIFFALLTIECLMARPAYHYSKLSFVNKVALDRSGP